MRGHGLCHSGPSSLHVPGHTPHFFLLRFERLFLSGHSCGRNRGVVWSRGNSFVSWTPWEPEWPLVQEEAWDQGPSERYPNKVGTVYSTCWSLGSGLRGDQFPFSPAPSERAGATQPRLMRVSPVCPLSQVI